MSTVQNFYEKCPQSLLLKADNPNFKTHGIKLPARIIVSAPSGTGKTNWVCNFIALMSAGSGTYSEILILTRDTSEALYEFLKLKSPSIQVLEGLQNLPDLNKKDNEINSLIIVDYLMLTKYQTRVQEYFIRCRKKNVTIIYLAQHFYKIPIIIRQNSNYVVILKAGNKKSLNMMLSEFSVGVEKEELLNMYKYATKDKFHFLLIDVDESNPERKFRKDFEEYLSVEQF